jgi:hypothetical protein
MERLVGPCLLFRRKRGLVHKEVGFASRLQHLARRTCVAGENDLATGARRPQHLLGSHGASVRKLDACAALQPAEERPLRDAERLRRVEVEAARTRALHQAVPVRPDAVLDREGEDAVVGSLEHVSGHELTQLHVVRELPEDPPENREEVDEARRPVHGERKLTAAKREGLEHPRQAEVVVGVVVRQEDLVQLDEPHRGAKELALGALTAIEEDPVAPAPDERSSEAAAGSRHRARCSEEDKVEVHGPSVGRRRARVPGRRWD